MTDLGLYPYATGNLLEDRNTYFYSKYAGASFLDAWTRQRAHAREAEALGVELEMSDTPALSLIRKTRQKLGPGFSDPETSGTLDRLIQRFEVTKRVHDSYRANWRATDPKQFRAIASYIELAETFCDAYALSQRLPLLNVLLKLLDTISSMAGDIPAELWPRVDAQIAREKTFIMEVRDRLASTPPPALPVLEPRQPVGDFATRTVLLACDSARSRAYIQAMCRSGVRPECVIFLGEEKPANQHSHDAPGPWRGLMLPDLSRSVSSVCLAEGIPVTHLPDRDVNAPSVRDALSAVDADLVVYSGVGGQIVSEGILTAGPRFLHCHSGWLPEYRGSTTFYFAILNNELPGVSSIFLDPGIDTGPILQRQKYPMPYAGMDVDLIYDPAIRADLLCKTLVAMSRSASMIPSIEQTPAVGETYYVIHPVLKHIALLSLEKTESDKHEPL